MKNTRTADFCAEQIDVLTNFAVIMNAVVKRVHCINDSAYGTDPTSLQNSVARGDNNWSLCRKS